MVNISLLMTMSPLKSMDSFILIVKLIKMFFQHAIENAIIIIGEQLMYVSTHYRVTKLYTFAFFIF